MGTSVLKRNNFLLLHLIVLLWGATGIMGREITMTPTDIVWGRLVIAVITLWGFAIYTRQPLTLRHHERFPLVIGGMFIAGHWWTFFAAIKASNITVPLTILGSTSFFVSWFRPVVRDSRFNYHEFYLSILALSGLALALSLDVMNWHGVWLAIASSLLLASFSLLNEQLVTQHQPLKVMFWELFFAALVTSFTSSFTSNGHFLKGISEPRNLILLVILGVVCTAFAGVISIKVMQTISAFTYCLTINLEPVYTITFAYFWYGESERMSSLFYLGGMVVLLSLGLDVLWKRFLSTSAR